MAITIDWGTKVIYIPTSFLTLIQSVPTVIYNLDLNDLRMALKDLEDGEEGINFLDTHRHNAEVTVGGITLARVIEMINGYTITFEDGQYAVNLLGANSNVADVVNVNQVSLRTANSAGLITTSGTGTSGPSAVQIATEVWGSAIAAHDTPQTFGERIGRKLLSTAQFLGLK
jgi:hypothetical protein